MSRSSVPRRVAAFLVILTLAVPLGAADRPRDASAPLSSLWQWMAAQWSKVGCGLDPNGCASSGQDLAKQPNAPATPNAAEVGCGLDPDGKPCPAGHP
jgi:hypothetical protein